MILLAAVLFSALFAGASARALEIPPLPPGVDIEVDAEDPVAARIAEAFRLLEKTPTGAALLKSSREHKVRWKFAPDFDWMFYTQGDNEVLAGGQFIARYPPEQLAYMFAHELEHARQIAIMKTPPGYNADELEFGGLSAQSRVWVELGAPVQAETWKAGRAWLKDNALWVSHPDAAYFSWRLRRFPGGNRAADSDEAGPDRVRAYWERLREEDAAWRRANKAILPDLPPEATLDAFRGTMDASLGVALDGKEKAPGEFSAWLPDFLQALPALKPGSDFPLPAAPSAKDLQLLSFVDHEVAVVKLRGGGWLLRSGSERTVDLDSLKGKMELLAHTHPPDIQNDALGRAPSSRDFFDDEAPALYLVTAAGLTRYKMPKTIRDPETGEEFDPRALDYQAFRDRIYGESGPPYSGRYAQEAVRDASAFYRRIGMEVESVSFKDAAKSGPFARPSLPPR